MRNWVIANTRMSEVLKAKGYPYQFVFAGAAGHVDERVQLQTMPKAFANGCERGKATSADSPAE